MKSWFDSRSPATGSRLPSRSSARSVVGAWLREAVVSIGSRSRARGLLLPLLTTLLAFFPRFAAASPADGLACLDIYDLSCAQANDVGGTGTDAQLLHARLLHNLGEFVAAEAAMAPVAASRPTDERLQVELEHLRATVRATEGFVEERRGDIVIRYLPGPDVILLDEAFETLAGARDRVAKRLGGAPPGGIRMEIYPTAARFTEASGLPKEAVQTTGVVALSKWTRLLLTSPRALGRGYSWKDTIAHEYIHYVVAWRTRDQAPVWLQEGIARSHEVFWRADAFAPLLPYQQSLVADALANDTLVPLPRMHPSMAFLDSANETALAFAQVSTMVEHLVATKGKDAVSQVLDRVRDGTDALVAVAAVGAGGDADAFMEGWKAMLREQEFVDRKLAAMPTVLGPAEDDFGLDPVLAERMDLAGKARLGDLLQEAGKPAAALIEYRKALPEDEAPSPVISAKMALSFVALKQPEEARKTLLASIRDYPEFALTRKLLGDLYAAAGDRASALTHYAASADTNPFDPEVQAALADLYRASGDAGKAARHDRNRRILAVGGATLSEN